MNTTPETKLHLIVTGVTTTVVFSIWTQLPVAIDAHPFLSVAGSLIVSVGFYRFVFSLFLFAFRKSRGVRKLLLGPYYMEGCWIGFFVSTDNTPRFYYEIFEQTLSTLVIKGKSHREDHTYHGTWIAEDVFIDTKVGKMTYVYHADPIGDTFINPGLATFFFMRESPDKPPLRMFGYASDLYKQGKLKSFEVKLSDATACIDSQEALRKAKELYEKEKDTF